MKTFKQSMSDREIVAAPAIIGKSLTPAQEAERATWQYRAIDRLRGNQTWAGRLLLSALGRVPSNPPWYGMTGAIDEDGMLWTSMVDRNREVHEAMRVAPVEIVVDTFKQLADVLDFTDAERIAMFDEVRRWVAKDLRAINNKEGDHD